MANVKDAKKMIEDTKSAAKILGSLGGKAKAEKMTRKERHENAKKMVKAREEKRYPQIHK